MSDHKEHLNHAMRDFNQTERAHFMLDTGAQWLGLDGPAYVVGDVRMKAFFVDDRGRHWVDAMLGVESLAGITQSELRNGGLLEGYRQLAAGMDEADDLWVYTDTRGRWNATMAPVAALAHTWGYPPPVRLPDGNWARTWLSSPERTDEQELGWIAHGGKPLDLYRDGSQL